MQGKSWLHFKVLFSAYFYNMLFFFSYYHSHTTFFIQQQITSEYIIENRLIIFCDLSLTLCHLWLLVVTHLSILLTLSQTSLGFYVSAVQAFFRSPEHNLLRVSYCDWSLSGVCLCAHPAVREQLLKKSSPLKPANRFQWNFIILG